MRANFSLILALLLASPFPLLLINGAGPIDFHQWCQRTSHRDVCNSVIQGDPRADLKTSSSGILTILTDGARNVVAACSAKVVALLESSSTSPKVKEGLKKCWIAYKRANQTIDLQDYGVINKDTYTKLNCNLGRIYDQPVVCEREFQGSVKSPLIAEDTNIMNIAEANAQILNIVQCNQTALCLLSNQFTCTF